MAKKKTTDSPVKTPKTKSVSKSISNAAPKSVPRSLSTIKPRVKPHAKPQAKLAPKKPITKAKILSSKTVYEGNLFRVLKERVIEPGGTESDRDIIRHNGSVVIVAADYGTKKGKPVTKPSKDPWIVIERQYRHAAGQFLWELPAGKLESGEVPLTGAVRELEEETGYRAAHWSPLIEYFASPGFLGEAMKVFLAEGLIPGDAHPDEDEKIEFRLVRLSELLEWIDKGKIQDGKTVTCALLYARRLAESRHKKKK